MASNIPSDLKYTKNDEWVRIEGDIATYGITDYAQDALSDIVYLDLPGVGDTITAGTSIGSIESVKAASDLYAAVSGTVTAVNNALIDSPEQVNNDPYGAAWMLKIKMSNPTELDALLDAAAYSAFCDERA